jgi:hypothetical protein
MTSLSTICGQKFDELQGAGRLFYNDTRPEIVNDAGYPVGASYTEWLQDKPELTIDL